ncbi:MAG: MotE family protein [Alphaproteobacteria bacterium]
MKHQPATTGRVRVLPIIMVTMGALGLIKFLGLALVGGYILQPISPAVAQDTSADKKPETDAKAGPADSGKNLSKVKAAQTMAGANPNDIDGRLVVLSDKPEGYSQAEAAVLESLRKRRKALDKRARTLEMQTNLLTVAEKRIDEKINELKVLQAKLDATFKDREKAEDKKLAGLVTMYSNMKPKDAARIFEGLDPPVLLGVARRLSPRKMSPILAKMSAKMAQSLTVSIAELNAAQAEAQARTSASELEAVPQVSQ